MAKSMAQPDFFISYTSTDEKWAIWIAWELEKVGYSCIFQARDFKPGSDFISQMRRAVRNSRQTIVLYSPDYFKSKYASAELQAVLAEDPIGEKKKLLPIRVLTCKPEDLLRGRIYIDLVGLSRNKARQRLLSGIEASRMGYRAQGSGAFNQRPYFPGSATGDSRTRGGVSVQTDSVPAVRRLRVLFFAAEAGFGLDFRGQLRAMRKAVSEAMYPGSIKFTPVFDVTPESLLSTLNKHNPHICHFSGNQDGGNILIRSDDGGIITISDLALAGLFRSLGENVRLVIIDTCESMRCASAVVKVVPFAIGVKGKIYDEDAIDFYSVFYRAIASGRSIGDAVGQARSKLEMSHIAKKDIPDLRCKRGSYPKSTVLVNPGNPDRKRRITN